MCSPENHMEQECVIERGRALTNNYPVMGMRDMAKPQGHQSFVPPPFDSKS